MFVFSKKFTYVLNEWSIFVRTTSIQCQQNNLDLILYFKKTCWYVTFLRSLFKSLVGKSLSIIEIRHQNSRYEVVSELWKLISRSRTWYQNHPFTNMHITFSFSVFVFFNVDNIFQIFLKNDFLTVQCI